MYRYLKYNPKYEKDGDIPPELVLSNYLIDKSGNIIGLRFEDKTVGNVWIDIPINRFIKNVDKNKKNVKNKIEKLINNCIYKVSLIAGGKTILKFSNPKNESIVLKDGFVPINMEEDVASFYFPTCIIRYKNEEFCEEGYKHLNTLGNFILNNVYCDMDIKYLRFINIDKPFIRIIISSETPILEYEEELEEWKDTFNMDFELDTKKHELMGYQSDDEPFDFDLFYTVEELIEELPYISLVPNGIKELVYEMPIIETDIDKDMYMNDKAKKAIDKRLTLQYPLFYTDEDLDGKEYRCVMAHAFVPLNRVKIAKVKENHKEG